MSKMSTLIFWSLTTCLFFRKRFKEHEMQCTLNRLGVPSCPESERVIGVPGGLILSGVYPPVELASESDEVDACTTASGILWSEYVILRSSLMLCEVFLVNTTNCRHTSAMSAGVLNSEQETHSRLTVWGRVGASSTRAFSERARTGEGITSYWFLSFSSLCSLSMSF